MTEKLKISTEFAKAFIKAQAEMSNPKKDSDNPFFKSKYADISAVREASLPMLNNNGIGVLQSTAKNGDKPIVKTFLVYESGEILDIGCDTDILFAKPNDPQAQGSGITYARRYGLQTLLTLAAEDDDGNKGAEQPKPKESKRNAHGLLPDGPLANGDDMKEMLAKKNEDDFAVLKAAIEKCADEEALKVVWTDKKNAKVISSLEKWRPELCELLITAKNTMKESFIQKSNH